MERRLSCLIVANTWDVIYNARSKSSHPPTPNLPPKMGLMIDPRDKWNVQYTAQSNRSQPLTSHNAPAKINHSRDLILLTPPTSSTMRPSISSHPPTSPNIAPATRNHSYYWSLSHVKRHLHARTNRGYPVTSPNNCACHAKWLSWLILKYYSWTAAPSNAPATKSDSWTHQVLHPPRKVTVDLWLYQLRRARRYWRLKIKYIWTGGKMPLNMNWLWVLEHLHSISHATLFWWWLQQHSTNKTIYTPYRKMLQLQYHSVWKSTTEYSPYYNLRTTKFCKEPLRTTKYYSSTTLYSKLLLENYSVLQSTTPVLPRAPCYKALLSTTKHYFGASRYFKVFLRTTQNYKVLQSVLPVLVRLIVATHETSSILRGTTYGMQNTLERRHSCLIVATLRVATAGVTSQHHQYCACQEKWLSWLIPVTHETSSTMRGATGATLQHHILHLRH